MAFFPIHPAGPPDHTQPRTLQAQTEQVSPLSCTGAPSMSPRENSSWAWFSGAMRRLSRTHPWGIPCSQGPITMACWDCCWQDFPTYTHRWWSPRYWVVDYCFFHSDHPQRKVYNFPVWRYGFCSLPNILWAFCLLSPPFLMMLKEPKSPNSELMGFIFKYLWSTISVPKIVHTHHCSHVRCWVYIRSVPLGQESDKSYQ